MRTQLRFNSTVASNGQILGQLRDWESRVRSAAAQANPDLARRLQFRGTVPLDALPRVIRNQYMDEYRKIIQFDSTLETLAGGPIAQTGLAGAERIARSPGLDWRRSIGTRNPYARFNVDHTDTSVLGHIYSQMNVQFRKPFGNTTPYSHFGIGTRSIQSIDMIRQSRKMAAKMRSGRPIMEKGAAYTVFDIETAGLDFGQIREVAFQSGRVGSAAGYKSGTMHFRVAEFNRGMLAHRGNPLSIEEFMNKRMGITYSGMKYGDGDEFVKKMMPFLQRLNKSKYVLGHNISTFDIQQIFTGLSGTAAYNRNSVIDGVNFREFVDNTFNGLQNKVIDTLQLAKGSSNLAGITTAAEIGARGGTELFSIENLILQTDLLNKAPELRSLIQQFGLHSGRVDTAITSRLAELMPTLQVGRGMPTDMNFRKQVASHSAITPITTIRNASDISDDLLRHMVVTGEGIDSASGDIRRLLGFIQNAGIKNDNIINRAMSMIRGGIDGNVSFNVNAIEQEIFHTRNLGLTSQNASKMDVLSSLGAFDRLTGRNIAYQGAVRKSFGSMNKTSWMRPSAKEFGLFQARLARAGMPYAGLSYEERKLGTAMSYLTSGLDSTPLGRKAAAIGADSLISRFETFNPANVLYAGANTGRSSIPLSILRDFDNAFANPLSSRPIMLGVSAFEYNALSNETAQRRYAVNLVYNFQNAAEAEALAGHIGVLTSKSDDEIAKALGVDPNSPMGKKAIKNFRNSSDSLISRLTTGEALETGISVGQIHDQSIAERVHRLMGEVRGGIDADDAVLDLRAALISSDDDVIRVGAPMLNKFIGDQNQVLDQARRASRFLEETLKPIASTARDSRLAEGILNMAHSDEAVKRMISMADFAQTKLIPKIPKTAGLSALALGGYYLYRKNKEQQQYDATMRQMPYEQGTSYSLASQIEARMLMGQNSALRMDPLATAPLVADIYQNRLNHSSMAFDKNTALYGGIL